MGRTTHRPSVWCSKHYFFFIISYRLRALKTLYFHFCKINWNDFCKEFCKKLWKKIILGTSDAWSTSHLSHQPSEPAYYIVDWRIYTSKVPLAVWYLICGLCTDRNNLVKLAIQVTQFLDLLFESTLMLVLSTETKIELINRK